MLFPLFLCHDHVHSGAYAGVFCQQIANLPATYQNMLRYWQVSGKLLASYRRDAWVVTMDSVQEVGHTAGLAAAGSQSQEVWHRVRKLWP